MYKEEIETLRSYGLGLEKESAYEEILKWLEAHDGDMPRGSIKINGKTLSKDEMTQEQLNERRLYARWRKSPERKALEECRRNINR